MLELFYVKSELWSLGFTCPLSAVALHVTQLINSYGCSVMCQWKRNGMWYAEGFLLLSVISDQIFSEPKNIKASFLLYGRASNSWIWKTMFFFSCSHC